METVFSNIKSVLKFIKEYGFYRFSNTIYMILNEVDATSHVADARQRISDESDTPTILTNQMSNFGHTPYAITCFSRIESLNFNKLTKIN